MTLSLPFCTNSFLLIWTALASAGGLIRNIRENTQNRTESEYLCPVRAIYSEENLCGWRSSSYPGCSSRLDFFSGGKWAWNSSGEYLTKGTVIIQENYCVSKHLSSEWDLLNAQQKIKGKMWKFWGLSGRMLQVLGVCSCRSVTMMACLCRVCTVFRSAAKMCHWVL